LFLDPDFELVFERPVTILTGENGVGKSTLLEGAQLLTISMRAVASTKLADTEHFRLLRDFCADPAGFLEQALRD